jgi:cyanophycin synthetase
VARLLCEAVNAEWPGTECRVVLDEVEALRSELLELQSGQVVIVFYDKLGPIQEVLREFGAEPVATIAAESGASATGV